MPGRAGRPKVALRISAGREAVEERPVGFVGVEERADSVVHEAAESEGGAFDAVQARNAAGLSQLSATVSVTTLNAKRHRDTGTCPRRRRKQSRAVRSHPRRQQRRAGAALAQLHRAHRIRKQLDSAVHFDEHGDPEPEHALLARVWNDLHQTPAASRSPTAPPPSAQARSPNRGSRPAPAATTTSP